MTAPVIEARGLSKWYGRVIGLNDVTCQIGPGITGLLGPNGAGKSTFLRLVSGQLRPSTGEVRVLGGAPWNAPGVLGRIGFCPDEDAFWDGLTGLEFVTALARVSGLPRARARERAAEVLEQVGMKEHMGRRIRAYSKGMRQRTKLAQALVHDPELLVLDEPLTGADPVGRRELRGLIARLAEQGKHVVVSSHVLHEVEALTSTVLLIARGRVLAAGQVQELRALLDEHPHRIAIRCDRPRELARALLALPHVVGVDVEQGALHLRTTDPAGFYAAVPGALLEVGATLEELASEDDDLSALFQYLVRR
ncbi:MAG: ABC transporter ATP-binding protein [Planctomycetes bacterium]|nr:ABC transporter ATP-binding protein [Planctomycetota bacterium]